MRLAPGATPRPLRDHRPPGSGRDGGAECSRSVYNVERIQDKAIAVTLAPGTTVGRYQILEPLGQGGIADVRGQVNNVEEA